MAEQAIERGEQVGVLLKKSLLSLSKNDEEGFHGVGCMGVVGQIKLLEEAKYAITLIGTQRFRVQRELSYYPYPIFVVDMLNDGHVPGYGSRMRKLRTFMEELFLDLYRLCEDHEGRMEWIIDLLDATFELDEEDFVNVACTNMPISTLEKQMLLEYSMTLERFEKAAEILEFEHQRRLLEGSMPLSGPSWDSLS
jgi:Lon protease-like protein